MLNNLKSISEDKITTHATKQILSALRRVGVSSKWGIPRESDMGQVRVCKEGFQKSPRLVKDLKAIAAFKG